MFVMDVDGLIRESKACSKGMLSDAVTNQNVDVLMILSIQWYPETTNTSKLCWLCMSVLINFETQWQQDSLYKMHCTQLE